MASRCPERRAASSWPRPAPAPATEGSSFGEPGERPISAAKARGRDPRRPPAARGRTDRRRPMPEGDTIHRTAAGLAPHLVGRQIIAARGRSGGPQVRRIVGATIDAVEAAGKNLLIRFDNGLELRTHMRMNGSWHRYRPGERWRRPESRARLDQRAIAGIGNIWRNETRWHERVDPWAAVRDLDDATLDRLVATAHRLLRASADLAPGQAQVGAYRRTGRPCPRCGTPIRSAVRSATISRTTYWCPSCQRRPAAPR